MGSYFDGVYCHIDNINNSRSQQSTVYLYISLLNIRSVFRASSMTTNSHQPEPTQNQLSTAGGGIICARCQAMSKRKKQQCGAPAERGKRVCRFHGARSSGPKTEEGRLRIARSKVQHGNETRETRAERSEKSTLLANLEDVMHVTNMTTAPRTRGRKPSGYSPITTLAGAFDFVARQLLRSSTPGNRSRDKN